MSWELISLGDLLTLKRGYDLPSSKRKAGVVPIVSSSGITGYHNTAKVQGPGVVTGRYGTLGEVFFLENDYWPLNTSLYVKDFKGSDPRFCGYYLKSILAGTTSDKAAVPGVNRNDLHARPIRVTRDRAAQRAIASILSAYDDLIENNRRRIQLLEQAARLLYKEWFVHLRFPGHEHVTITDGVPEGWLRNELEDLCPGKGGIQTGPFGSQLHQSDYTDGGVPVVMPQDLKSLRITTDKIARIPEALADKLSRHCLRSGDIIYGRRGDIGRRALVSERQAGYLCGTGCLRLRPDAARVDPDFLYQALGENRTQEGIRNRAKGSTMPNLSAKAMAPVPLITPPRALQEEYASFARATTNQVEALDEAARAAERARDLLLPRLMNGEIAV